MAVGFIIAGPMLRFFGPYVSLAVLALFFLISSLTAMKLPSSRRGELFFKKLVLLDVRSVLTKIIGRLKDGLSYVRHAPVLFDSVLLLTGTQIIMVMLSTLGPGFADKVMGIDVTDASYFIIGPAVVGMLVGVFWVGSQGFRYKTQTLIQRGILGAGLVLVIISVTIYLKRFAGFGWLFTDTIIIPLELFLFFLLGAFNSLLDVPANSTLQKEAVGEMRGRVYGVLTAFVGGVGILPVMIGGILADTVGVGKVILFLGVFIVIYGMLRMRQKHVMTS
jgi:hypothetical protein